MYLESVAMLPQLYMFQKQVRCFVRVCVLCVPCLAWPGDDDDDPTAPPSPTPTSSCICPHSPLYKHAHKQSSQVVEVLIGHWVFASGFARVLDMIFWMSSYHELVDHSGT